MKPIAGQPILTVEQMRAAEAHHAPTPDALYGLMERAGAGVADAVRRVAAGAEVLVLCGPGNNGGDGYVAARVLREQGVAVRVARSGPPRTSLAQRAGSTWAERVEELEDAEPAPILVDALFGTGLSRRIGRDTMSDFGGIALAARYRVAVDLPSGWGADRPDWWADVDCPVPEPHLTLALGALKPVHVLPWAMTACGEIRLIDLGLDLARWPVRVIDRPHAPTLSAAIHKYSRGMVGIVAGAMPGAALLAATAAARAGAGYVVVFGAGSGGPESLVHRPLSEEALSDERLGAIVIGPGLGRDDEARRWVDFLVKETRRNLVIDADALHLVDLEALGERVGNTILTPHHGEYEALRRRLGHTFPPGPNIIEETIGDLAAFNESGLVTMVRKGFTTYIVNRERVRVSTRANPWLSTAGTGDVLAGAIGAMLALYANQGRPGYEAASAGVWLHAQAAHRLGASFIADDLALELTATRASL